MLCRHPARGITRSALSEKAAAAESEQRRLFLTGARELARLHDEVSKVCVECWILIHFRDVPGCKTDARNLLLARGSRALIRMRMEIATQLLPCGGRMDLTDRRNKAAGRRSGIVGSTRGQNLVPRPSTFKRG